MKVFSIHLSDLLFHILSKSTVYKNILLRFEVGYKYTFNTVKRVGQIVTTLIIQCCINDALETQCQMWRVRWARELVKRCSVKNVDEGLFRPVWLEEVQRKAVDPKSSGKHFVIPVVVDTQEWCAFIYPDIIEMLQVRSDIIWCCSDF